MSTSVKIDDKSLDSATHLIQYLTEHPLSFIILGFIIFGAVLLWKLLQWNPSEKKYQSLLSTNNQKLAEIKSELTMISRSQEGYIKVLYETRDIIRSGFNNQSGA